MTEQDIKKLKDLLPFYKVAWVNGDTILRVLNVGTHPEEGTDPCAIFERGRCANLYNCDLNSFHIMTKIA